MRHQGRPDDVAEVVWCRHRPHRILALGLPDLSQCARKIVVVTSSPVAVEQGCAAVAALAVLARHRPWAIDLGRSPSAACLCSIDSFRLGTSFSAVQIEQVMSFCIRQVRTTGKFTCKLAHQWPFRKTVHVGTCHYFGASQFGCSLNLRWSRIP